MTNDVHRTKLASAVKLWRPRFSVRTLAIFVTLVCAYFGAWEATKQHIENVYREECCFWMRPNDMNSPMPFVYTRRDSTERLAIRRRTNVNRLEYYIWLLGPTFRVPFESNWGPEHMTPTRVHGGQI